MLTAIDRARLTLEGLSVGDAFGEQFFGESALVHQKIVTRRLEPGPWRYTDDTEMALSIVDQLTERGEIAQDDLARRFAQRMDLSRGYGKGAFETLQRVLDGQGWREAARSGFRGMGSFGNGAAMRVAPLGAFFSNDSLGVVVEQAQLSAEVTHAHAEGVAGAIAVAVATALAFQSRNQPGPLGVAWLTQLREWVPAGYTRDAIDEAIALPASSTIVQAAKALGNGSGVTAPDTVPLCLWVAAHHGQDFAEALWLTVSALGDRDTTCAIVGGILAAKLGIDAIPTSWRTSRESLPT